MYVHVTPVTVPLYAVVIDADDELHIAVLVAFADRGDEELVPICIRIGFENTPREIPQDQYASPWFPDPGRAYASMGLPFIT